MNSRSLKLFCLLLLVFFLASCNKKSQEALALDSYLRVPLSDKNINLDPSGDWIVPNAEVFSVFYDPLYRIGTDGKLLPSLAADFPKISDDKKLYRISLKSDVRFHDDESFESGKGRSVKAQDVIYSLKRITDPKNETGLWSLIEGKIEGLDEYRKSLQDGKGNFDNEVAGLKAINDRELQITLTKPYSQILFVLAMPAFSIVPHEAVSYYGDEFKHHAVGTGPFRLKSYSSNQIVAERTGKSAELPPGIIFSYFDDQWNAFKEGHLDIAYIESRRLHAYIDDHFQLKQELKSAGYGLFSIKEAYRNFIIFNHKNPLMQNIHLRKAIAYAIPWANIIDEEDSLSAAFIPEPIAGSTNLQWKYDPAKAKQELALAGYPGGAGLPELVMRVRYPVRLFVAGMVQDALQDIGIRLRLELSETNELEDAHLGSQGWVLDFPDALSILALLSSHAFPPDGNNYGYFQNAEYDALIEKALSLGEVDRAQHYAKLGQWIYDHVVVIPFRQTQIFYGLRPGIKNVSADPLGYLQWAQIIKTPKP